MSAPNAPETLWHYTDANGLYGIISSSRLGFGDARFLNDRTERIYGEQLLDRVFDEVVAADSSGITQQFRELVRVLRLPDRLYVCSLSETKESISQWQRYGADGAGYCIGFSRRHLDDLLDEDQISREVMMYQEDAQMKLLREAVVSGLDQYRRVRGTEQEPRSGYYEYLFTDMDIDAAVLQMKNPFFHDEQEWRYFFRSDEDEDEVLDDETETADDDEAPDVREQFAVRGAYVKPYVELPRARGDVAERLPVVGVVCGPKLDGDLAVPTVGRFLRSCGYRVPVEHSKLAEIWR